MSSGNVDNSERSKAQISRRDELGVYIGNLPTTITEDEIKNLISDYENVEFLRLIKKEQKTFCFLRCPSKESIINVVRTLHRKEIMGRKICVKASDDEIQKCLFGPYVKSNVSPKLSSGTATEDSALNSRNSSYQYVSSAGASPVNNKEIKDSEENSEKVSVDHQEKETEGGDEPPSHGLHHETDTPTNVTNSGRTSSAHSTTSASYENVSRESKELSENASRYGPLPLAILGNGPPPLGLANEQTHFNSGYCSKMSSVSTVTSDSYHNCNKQRKEPYAITAKGKGPPPLGIANYAGFAAIRSDRPPPHGLAPPLLSSCSSHNSRIFPNSGGFAASARHSVQNIGPPPPLAKYSYKQQPNHDLHLKHDGRNFGDITSCLQSSEQGSKVITSPQIKGPYDPRGHHGFCDSDSTNSHHGRPVTSTSSSSYHKNYVSGQKYIEGMEQASRGTHLQQMHKVQQYSPNMHSYLNHQVNYFSYSLKPRGVAYSRDYNTSDLHSYACSSSSDSSSLTSASCGTSVYQNNNDRQICNRPPSYMANQQTMYEQNYSSSRFARQNHFETEIEGDEDTSLQLSGEEKESVIKDLESAEFLLVSNFPFRTSEEDIFYLFEDFQPLGVWITNNEFATGKCTEAYVAVPNEKLALDAIMQLDNTMYRRRLLIVTDAKQSNILSELLELYGYSSPPNNSCVISES